MPTILIVEDDPDIRDILKTYLQIEKFHILEAETLSEMRNVLNREKSIDIMLLDIMLPDGDSVDELPRIRMMNRDMGIIIISAKNTDRDKIWGIESGSDDYITKPFNPKEVVVRVRALLKRIKNDNEIIKYGNLEIYPNNYSVKYNNEVIEFTSKEFEILYLLAKKPERIYTRDDIISKIWFDDNFITDRVIDVHVSMIRSKIGKEWIKTIRGVGYKFNPDADLLNKG
ncbi:response regulator transcription factor [Geotoga petraea]|jgi:two-component system OmpR family response regulator|uniref:Response regulator transcription factor n=1 Tax=Geotoga petraea TaxID=28234 RepID=A0A1G6JXU0_9BACT|nr:response regulator transcription factor [Geotoga petraea]MDK2945665.1 two-component system, OmpR family, response regulator [Geotoga sp.]TGG88355.1 response regulator transcription factor [Geotoga petraea]SDC23513.1 two-component system, OmpR family, response regulator [Geotoga petraea]